MLRDNACVPEVRGLLPDAGFFYEDAHQKVAAALYALAERGVPADLVTLGEELIRLRQVEDVGGLAYLGELHEAAPTAANVLHYARIVRDRATKRNLIHAATEILRDAYGSGQPADEMLGNAERLVLEIAERGGPVCAGYSAAEASALADARFEAIMEAAKKNGGGVVGVPSGLTDLDRLTGGWQEEHFVVIGARPNQGKTLFGGACLLEAARRGTPALFVSLEQPVADLLFRFRANEGRLDLHRILSGRLAGEEPARFADARDRVRELPFWVEHPHSLTLHGLKAMCRRYRRRHGVGLVVIDYLQKLQPDPGADNREQAVGDLAKGVCALGKELKVPVILLAQLNRESEREKRRPRLSDIRESGQVENEADIVLLLHPEPDEGQVKVLSLIMAKHRNGPKEDVKVAVYPAEMRLENYARDIPIHYPFGRGQESA
jgi:replicative DNA helicase